MPILNVRIFTPSDIVKYYVEQPDVKVIYIRPTGEWRYHSSQQITSLRKNMLEPLLNYSSKIRGKGNFNYYPGRASNVPEDSLWLVQNGWTIGQNVR